MAGSARQGSIFAQKLDRIAFTSYFLGAIVPLVALAFIVERFVLPSLGEARLALGFIAVVLSLAVLSLGSFLVLRRTIRQSLRQIDGDNKRLKLLLNASQHLSSAQDESDAAAMTARCAFDVVEGSRAFVLTRDAPGSAFQLLHATGDGADKLFEKRESELHAVANLALSEGRPVIHGGEGGRGADGIAATAVPIPGDVSPLGALVVVRDAAPGPFEPAQVDSLGMLVGLASVAFRHANLQDAQRNFFTHVTDIIVMALDAHLGYHTGHPHRVAQLSNRIGRELGFDEHRLERLHFGALLHDIGMLKLDRTLQKNRLTCRSHTELGYRMLQRIRLWRDLAPIVHHHHEWYDGSGYPAGLAGEAIPIGSRIIGLCEAFDTMTSSKSYKAPLSWDDGLQEVERCTGTQFDPDVVRAFMTLVERGDIDPTIVESV